MSESVIGWGGTLVKVFELLVAALFIWGGFIKREVYYPFGSRQVMPVWKGRIIATIVALTLIVIAILS